MFTDMESKNISNVTSTIQSPLKGSFKSSTFVYALTTRQCKATEDMRGLKIDIIFFLKMLNGERLINLKHKPLEGDNGDCRTPGVVNTVKVDVLKI